MVGMNALAKEPAKEERRAQVRSFKRDAILAAARRVFAARGLGRSSLRAIAAEAGYVAGALYAYYNSREEIYADLLARSLAELQKAMRHAMAGAATAGDEVEAGALAFYRFYEANPDDLQLGLYLTQGFPAVSGPAGQRPKGLGKDLDRQLNGRLIACLTPLAEAFGRAGAASADEARLLTLDLMASLTGALVLKATGRISMLGGDAETQVVRAARRLVEMARG